MKFRNINNTLITHDEQAAQFVDGLADGEVCDLHSMEYQRSNSQNRKLWPALDDIANHVEWFGRKHDKDTWKHILSAAWRHQEFVQGIGNTLVVIPIKTSGMNKKEFGEYLTSIMAFGDEHKVPWSDPALELYQTYKGSA